MGHYTKKPVTIEAVQVRAADWNGDSFDGSPFSETPEWIRVAMAQSILVPVSQDTDYAVWDVTTNHGVTRAEPGDWIVRQVDGEIYPCKNAVFQATYGEEGVRSPILMSPQNSTGWKLEELLVALRVEIKGKCAKIEGDTRPVARAVLRNNEQILGLLRQAEALQRDSYDRLNAMAPDEGPLGTPRIGVGSVVGERG